MVETVDNTLFYLAEVDDHAVMIQLARAAIDGDKPVVAMQLGTLALVVEAEAVSCRYFDLFFDIIHTLYGF